MMLLILYNAVNAQHDPSTLYNAVNTQNNQAALHKAVNAQHNHVTFKVCITAFYNLENFYDTTNNPMVNDDDFTVGGIKHYDQKIYQDKINHLAKVISEIGTEISVDGVAILGVAEIENDTVLKDLIHHPLLAKRNYQFVHYDSKDIRGIDVALLYNPNYFKIESSGTAHVRLPNYNKNKFETRDILWVNGLLDGEPVYIFVNHWPSKRGDEAKTTASRSAAAASCRTELNKIFKKDPSAKIIVMGDLNDNPDSYPITKVLESKASPIQLKQGELYNPWAVLYQKGFGTLANQDSWSLFDQILLSEAWISPNQSGFYFYRQQIFKRLYMVENSGRYKGYPMRTWDGNNYRGGYSDHFPTYIILLKNTH